MRGDMYFETIKRLLLSNDSILNAQYACNTVSFNILPRIFTFGEKLYGKPGTCLYLWPQDQAAHLIVLSEGEQLVSYINSVKNHKSNTWRGRLSPTIITQNSAVVPLSCRVLRHIDITSISFLVLSYLLPLARAKTNTRSIYRRLDGVNSAVTVNT